MGRDAERDRDIGRERKKKVNRQSHRQNLGINTHAHKQKHMNTPEMHFGWSVAARLMTAVGRFPAKSA